MISSGSVGIHTYIKTNTGGIVKIIPETVFPVTDKCFYIIDIKWGMGYNRRTWLHTEKRRMNYVFIAGC